MLKAKVVEQFGAPSWHSAVMTALYFYACLVLKLTLVAGQTVHYLLKGRDAVLSPVLPSAPDDILWKHNGDKVITFVSAGEHVFPPYEGRVTLGHETAELTIADVGYEDSGAYELDALIRDRLHRSQYMLKVLDKVSKPVIRCEVSDDSGNSTVRRATLLCSSDSDTPETLTFKWNLEKKSQLGQSLNITLGNEHDHMEYSCTATNPLQAKTSVFMAKDCYTERRSEALYIIVSTVIASLILLAILLIIVFWHKKKRVCSKQRENVDLENEAAETDDKSKDESRPLVEPKKNDDVEMTSRKEDMQQLPAAGNVQKKIQMFEHCDPMEQHSDTPTEEEIETGIDKKITSQPPIRNGQVDSNRETDTNHVELERGSDSDSNKDLSHSPSSDPQALLLKTHEHEEALNNSTLEVGPKTDTAGDTSHSDQQETAVASEEKGNVHENLARAEPHSETLTEEENETGRDKRQTVTNHLPILERGRDSDSQDNEFFHAKQHQDQLSHSLSSDPQALMLKTRDHEAALHNSTLEVVPKTDTAGDSIQSDQQETAKTSEKKDPAPQPPHQSNVSVSQQYSQPDTVKSESKEETRPKDTSTSASELKDPQTDVPQNESATSEHKPTGESELFDDSQRLSHLSNLPERKNVVVENEAAETETTKDMAEPTAGGYVKKMVKIFENPANTESLSDTPTEEENGPVTDKKATPQPVYPIRNGQVDSGRQDNEFNDAPQQQDQLFHSLSSDPQALLLKTQEHEAALHNSTLKVVPKTVTAGDSIHSDQQETAKASEEKDPAPQPLHQSNVSVSQQYSQPDTVKSESEGETRPDDTSTSASELKDPQTDVPQNKSLTSEHKATGESKLFNDSQKLPQLSNLPVCSKQRKNVDLENEAAETDDKSNDKNKPLTKNAPKKNDVTKMTSQKEEITKDMEEPTAGRHVKKTLKKLKSLDHTEPHSDTPTVLTEEENETGRDKKATSQPAHPVRNGQVDSDAETDPYHVPELERGSDSDSNKDKFYDSVQHQDSVQEAAESTHPPASTLSQSVYNKESKGTNAENVSSAQVSEETKGNTDKETDSQDSEQIHEATKEGQQ